MTAKPRLKSLEGIRRRTVTLSEGELVQERFLRPDQQLPLVIEPQVEGLDLVQWAKENHQMIEQKLLQYGGILFRGFGVSSDTFPKVISAVSEAPMEYQDRATPRSQVEGNIYTSTEFAADQRIELHNESAYAFTWAGKVCFFCETPSPEGGETPIADCRRILARIDPAVAQRLNTARLMYVRNFGEGLGQPWQVAFNTDDPDQLEAFCREAQIEVEWKDGRGNRLFTRQVRPAIIKHPRSGEWTWFNQATAFHVTTLPPAVREALTAEFAEDELPKNVLYGDGTPLEAETLAHIRAAYAAETVAFPWQRGDLLLLDNMLVAHGREPYAGPRRILVGMSEPYSWDTVEAA